MPQSLKSFIIPIIIQYVNQCKSISRTYKAPFKKILVDAQQIKTHATHRPHLTFASSILSHRLIQDRDSLSPCKLNSQPTPHLGVPSTAQQRAQLMHNHSPPPVQRSSEICACVELALLYWVPKPQPPPHLGLHGYSRAASSTHAEIAVAESAVLGRQQYSRAASSTHAKITMQVSQDLIT